jgi:predicted phosphodiesterase
MKMPSDKKEEKYLQEREKFFETLKKLGRRDFLKYSFATAGMALARGVLPPHSFQLIEAIGNVPSETGTGSYASPDTQIKFTFAYISDTHLYERKLNERFVRAAMKAVNDVNALDPQPDFILFGGDLAQLGKPKELELGKEILSELKAPVHMMVGEHDWYLDMGEKWRELFGKPTYSFDHKGVHFVVLNSVIVEDYWTGPGLTPEERMKAMAQLDNPNGRPFTVGEAQRDWLERDLAKVSRKTPVIIFSHSPLYKYYKPWNFWTDDAEEVQAILKRFKSVTVIHGHTHQPLFNKIGNIHFFGMLSTAWPWPYAPSGLPKLTIKMNRADPFDQFDGCGDGKVDVLSSGRVNKIYNLWSRDPLRVSARYLASNGRNDIPPLPQDPSF